MLEIILVLCAGCALSVGGLFLQGIFRNPLASPATLGISQAAVLGSLVAFYLVPIEGHVHMWIGGALFSVGACFLFLGIGKIMGSFTGLKFVLAGIGFGLACMLVTSGIIPVELYHKGRFYWLFGNFSDADRAEVIFVALVTLVSLLILIYHSEYLNYLLLDDVQASSMGVDVQSVRPRLIFIVSVMVSAASGVVGMIALAGLVVPHVIRLVAGSNNRVLVPACALAGPLYLLTLHLVAKTLPESSLSHVGIISLAVGIPAALGIVITRRSWL